MGLPCVPTTELEAVNTMLSYCGELPVNTLEDSGVAEVSLARSVLHNVLREVQTEGLEFNSESEYRLVPDVDGYIQLPTNVLKVDPVYRSKEIVRRGNRLYDKKNHTYVFTEPLEVDITWFIPFEESPPSVREYVAIVASRRYVGQVVGSGTLDDLTADDEFNALVRMRRDECDTGDYSIFDSYDVARVLLRHSVPIRKF